MSSPAAINALQQLLADKGTSASDVGNVGAWPLLLWNELGKTAQAHNLTPSELPSVHSCDRITGARTGS
jgi:hypothetical protein